jgi:hypothetical protein
LTVIESAEQSFLDLVEILYIHPFLLFLDLDQLKEGIGTRSFSILLHVALKDFLYVFFAELARVDLIRY